jgi:diaminopimelate decarboxylase
MHLTRPLLDRIAAEQGASFYLLDTARFAENFQALVGAFRRHYPATSIAYSYKTNYIPRLCQIVEALGGFAEVVSGMEARIALRAGIARPRIFFNGPVKEAADVADLLLGGGIVNVDSLADLTLVEAVARAYPAATLRIGLRCNFDVGDGVASRFGVDVDGAEYREARARIAGLANLHLVGLHCHFATRTLACWQGRTIGMLEVLRRHFDEGGGPLDFVSLGGGMYGDMPPALQAQFPTAIPSFDDYADAAAKPFAAFFASRPDLAAPTLIIEPGTALAADAVKFAAQVVSIKTVNGRSIATLAGSTYNVNPNPNRKNVPIALFPADGARGTYRGMDFAGYTCIEGDYLYRGYDGSIAEGDFVVFDDVGSYSVVMKPPFIQPNVAIIEIGAGDALHVIKRREVFDDLFQTYSFDPLPLPKG